MFSLMCAAFMVFFTPAPQGSSLGGPTASETERSEMNHDQPNGYATDNEEEIINVQNVDLDHIVDVSDFLNLEEELLNFDRIFPYQHTFTHWYEEELEEDLRWSFALNYNGILHVGRSEFQTLTLLDTKRFGKVLIIDGKLQSAERDEFIYHESLVHPALLIHDNPKSLFIMGGGEGSTAREALRHRGIEKVVMCDIDREVVNICRECLTENQENFNNQKLQVVINDAKDELEKVEEKLRYLDGEFIVASTILNKTIRASLANETNVITEENARFIHGHGATTNHSSWIIHDGGIIENYASVGNIPRT